LGLETAIWGFQRIRIPKLGLKLKNWNTNFMKTLGYYFDHVLNFELSREIMKVLPPKKKNPAT